MAENWIQTLERRAADAIAAGADELRAAAERDAPAVVADAERAIDAAAPEAAPLTAAAGDVLVGQLEKMLATPPAWATEIITRLENVEHEVLGAAPTAAQTPPSATGGASAPAGPFPGPQPPLATV